MSGSGYATVLGAQSTATSKYSLAVGYAATASATGATTLGYNASATTANSVALGSNSVANSTTLTTAGFTPVGGTAISAATAAGGEVSVGAAGKERRVTNVAAGPERDRCSEREPAAVGRREGQ
ncbi:hypothetical protein ACFFYR_10525 [Paraburkholderia dipogonis]|uniref:hypothetical protein n=1 Tax=Paraburkholderia dipogonis TaxID=1211383 RepID=UPI0035E9AB30